MGWRRLAVATLAIILFSHGCVEPYDDFQQFWERDSVTGSVDGSAEVTPDLATQPDGADTSLPDIVDEDIVDAVTADTQGVDAQPDLPDAAELTSTDVFDVETELDSGDTGPVCGDDACEGEESCLDCPEDCGECPYCGDAECNAGEDCVDCPEDCGQCCGNGECTEDHEENCLVCPEDCGECCGNELCDEAFGEACLDCPEDCGECCGNDICEADFDENCNWCPDDCGECCGDQICSEQFNENCQNCAADCGECCGNGQCEVQFGENCAECPEDCEQCCGNGFCEPELDENCDDCPADCGCEEDQVCFDNQCCAPGCGGVQCGDDGCGGECGICAPQHICEEGICTCVPDCDGKECGGDGCGGSCGHCPDVYACQQFQCECEPDCDGLQCGDDGCGGSCGECLQDVETCDQAFGSCLALSLPVPAGDFWMGCNSNTGIACHANELPYHQASTGEYSMDAVEVTNARFVFFLNWLEQMGSPDDCSFQGLPMACIDPASSGFKLNYLDDQWVVSPLWKHHPVTGATWYGASSYCQWTGGRLCTEAEWVKGARGGCEILGALCKLISPAFPWGNQAPDCDQANAGYCNSGTQPAAQYPDGISKYGMYDMLGNVWELVGDCWHGDFTGAPTDGAAWVDDCLSESKVRVGGAYNVSASNVSIHIRAMATPDVGIAATGFRCCHD